jgi:predicted ATP-grasp superfamily ATP-dependent carboligase
VLITDGDTRQALAATRSLGRAGHYVVVVAERSRCLAGVSRHAAAAEDCPSGTAAPGSFASKIAALARRYSIDVVLPMTEISTLLLTRERDYLPPACALPFPTHASVRRASNKAEVLGLARAVGLPVPDTQIVHSPAEASVFESRPTFPLVVKPACSRVLTANGWISNAVSYAKDPGELSMQLARLAPESFPVLLQERIYGPGIGIFLLFDRGHPVARFSHRRLREKPPSGGVSVLCESVAVEPSLAAGAEALLRDLDWHGPAMVEFKRDERDGTSRVMEINGRFWGSLQLAIDAGVDFPTLLVDVARGAAPAVAPAFTSGVRSRWVGGDLDALLMTMLKPRRQLNLPAGHPGKLHYLWNFLRTRHRDTRLEVERWDDLRPAAYEWRRHLTGS